MNQNGWSSSIGQKSRTETDKLSLGASMYPSVITIEFSIILFDLF